MTISERLFSEMDARGVRAVDLCRELGINTSVTTGWKQRNTDPPAKYIIRICKFLGCSVEYLLTGEEPAQETKKEPAREISRNGLEMLEIYELLPEREQLLEIGRLQAIIEPMIGDLHRLKYYDAEVMDDIRRQEQERKDKAGRGPGGVSSGGKAV